MNPKIGRLMSLIGILLTNEQVQFGRSRSGDLRSIVATGFQLNIKISETNKFASPYLWFCDWAKNNQDKLPKQIQSVTTELELFSNSRDKSFENEKMKCEEETNIVNEVADELSYDERNDRLHLERKVERAFYEAGRALKELRDRRLYRNTNKTFEEYCCTRFGYGKNNANMKILAANVVDELEKMTTIGGQILPTSERQVRPLTKLEPEQQRQAWKSAVESAGGKVPSGRIVFDIVQQIKEKIVLPNPYHVGEVCRIIGSQDYPEIKDKGGQWCIICEVHDRCCTVRIYQGEIEVNCDNLRRLDYSSTDCEVLNHLCDRLQKIYTDDLEDIILANLNLIGKIDRAYLTDFEEQLLSLIEVKIK